MTRVTLPRNLARKLVCGSSRSESTLRRFPGRSEQSLGGPGRAVVVGAMCVVLFAGLSTEFRWKSVVVRLSGRSVITRVLPMRAPEREIVSGSCSDPRGDLRRYSVLSIVHSIRVRVGVRSAAPT